MGSSGDRMHMLAPGPARTPLSHPPNDASNPAGARGAFRVIYSHIEDLHSAALSMPCTRILPEQQLPNKKHPDEKVAAQRLLKNDGHCTCKRVIPIHTAPPKGTSEAGTRQECPLPSYILSLPASQNVR